MESKFCATACLTVADLASTRSLPNNAGAHSLSTKTGKARSEVQQKHCESLNYRSFGATSKKANDTGNESPLETVRRHHAMATELLELCTNTWELGGPSGLSRLSRQVRAERDFLAKVRSVWIYLVCSNVADSARATTTACYN